MPSRNRKQKQSNENKYNAAIIKNYDLLVRSLDPSDTFLNHLQVAWIRGAVERAKTGRTPDGKSGYLIYELLQVTSKEVDSFLRFLRLYQQDHVANILDKQNDKVPMSEENLKLLDCNKSALCRFIDPCGGLLNELVSSGVFCEDDKDRVEEDEDGKYDEIAQRLLTIIRRKSNCCFNKFLDALDSTDQMHVVYILIRKGDVKPICDQDLDRLNKKFDRVMSSMEPVIGGLLDKLVSFGVFTDRDQQRVLAKKTATDQSRKLLMLIRRKSQSSYNHLKDALISSQQSHIAIEIFGNDVCGILECQTVGTMTPDEIEPLEDDLREELKYDAGFADHFQENGITLRYDKGSIRICFTCSSIASLDYLQLQYTQKNLDRLLTERYCPLFSDRGLQSLKVNISPEEFDRCRREFHEETLMTDEHHRALQGAAETLADQLQVTPRLIESLTLDQSRTKAILDETPGKDQAQMLLRILSHRQDSAFMKFIRALREDDQRGISIAIQNYKVKPSQEQASDSDSLQQTRQNTFANFIRFGSVVNSQQADHWPKFGKVRDSGTYEERIAQERAFMSCEGYLSSVSGMPQVSISVTISAQSPTSLFRVTLCGTSVSAKTKDGALLLFKAAVDGNVNDVTHLLSRPNGLSVQCEDFMGRTALWFAAAHGHVGVIEYLLKHDRDIDHGDKSGISPLYVAAQQGHATVTRLLLNKSASVNSRTVENMSPLSIACAVGSIKVVKQLLAQPNIDLECEDVNGRKPLLYAAAKGSKELVEILLKGGANVNCRDKNNFTALHAAVYSGQLCVVKLLLEHDADVDVKARDGSSPLSVATTLQRNDMIGPLINSSKGSTPFSSSPVRSSQPGNNFDDLVSTFLSTSSPEVTNQHIDVSIQQLKRVQQQAGTFAVPASAADLLKMEGSQQLLSKMNISGFKLAPLPLLQNPAYSKRFGNSCDVTSKLVHSTWSPLFQAVLRGDAKAVQELVAIGDNVNGRTALNDTPLHIASYYGNLKCVKALMKCASIDVNAQTCYGTTAVAFAAERGHNEVLRKLLDRGADMSIADVQGRKPIWFAVANGRTDTLQIMLERKALQSCSVEDATKLLFVAISRSHTDVTRILIENGVDANANFDFSVSPLGFAAERGLVDIVQVLLEHEASIKHKDKLGRAPLWFAAANGRTEVVSTLIEHDADVNDASLDGFTPLHIAAHEGHLESVQVLVDNNANVNSVTAVGCSALGLASANGHHEIAKLLLSKSAVINSGNGSGVTPLMAAAASIERRDQVINLLIDSGADIGAQTSGGETALHFCALSGNVDNAIALLDNGAEIDAKKLYGKQFAETCEGVSPLHNAVRNSHFDMTRFLLQHGANVNSTSKRGITPLMMASEIGHIGIINLLLDENAHINLADENGMTALLFAANIANSLLWLRLPDRHLAVIDVLLARGASVNCQASEGITPLFLAASQGNDILAKKFVANGADVSVARKLAVSHNHDIAQRVLANCC